MKKETIAIRMRAEQTHEMEHSSPLFLTSSFTFDNADTMRAAFAEENDENIYSRYSNPTVDEFIQKMCLLEEAEAGVATASGMAAVFNSLLGLLQSGDHLLCSNAVFGSTFTVVTKYLQKFGISSTLVAFQDFDKWKDCVQPNTRMILLETPTNPQLDIIDLRKVSEFCKKHGLLLNVDNCFATPVIQNPIVLGADIVTHSATKWIDGQGRVLGGVILGKKSLIRDIYLFCRNTGPTLSAFNAWVLSKSLETLHVRIEKHSQNAQYLANKLENHENLQFVKYPFLPSHPQYEIAKKQMKLGGGIFCFELKNGLEAGKSFLNNLQLISMTPNLGDSRTIASHPASTTHSKLTEEERQAVGITPGLIRISVGLEHPDDVLEDIFQALDGIGL